MTTNEQAGGYRSFAEWPPEVGLHPSVSTDDHYTEAEAKGVCRLLERNGFGGDRVHFPLRTWVEPIPYAITESRKRDGERDCCNSSSGRSAMVGAAEANQSLPTAHHVSRLSLLVLQKLPL